MASNSASSTRPPAPPPLCATAGQCAHRGQRGSSPGSCRTLSDTSLRLSVTLGSSIMTSSRDVIAPIGVAAPPYLTSLAMGWPMCARCARIWCVRPVRGSQYTATHPDDSDDSDDSPPDDPDDSLASATVNTVVASFAPGTGADRVEHLASPVAWSYAIGALTVIRTTPFSSQLLETYMSSNGAVDPPPSIRLRSNK